MKLTVALLAILVLAGSAFGGPIRRAIDRRQAASACPCQSCACAPGVCPACPALVPAPAVAPALAVPTVPPARQTVPAAIPQAARYEYRRVCDGGVCRVVLVQVSP